MKIYYALFERHRIIKEWQKEKNKADKCKQYPFLVSQWDFRIAELYGEIGNLGEISKCKASVLL